MAWSQRKSRARSRTRWQPRGQNYRSPRKSSSSTRRSLPARRPSSAGNDPPRVILTLPELEAMMRARRKKPFPGSPGRGGDGE